MTREELTARIQAIGTCESETDRLELLSQLEEEAGADYDRLTNLETNNNQLTSDNEKLREANMKLFLRIGDKKPPKDDHEEEKPKEMKFEDLFNDKGEIK